MEVEEFGVLVIKFVVFKLVIVLEGVEIEIGDG